MVLMLMIVLLAQQIENSMPITSVFVKMVSVRTALEAACVFLTILTVMESALPLAHKTRSSLPKAQTNFAVAKQDSFPLVTAA